MDDEKLCLISIGVVVIMVIILAGWTYVDEEGWPWDEETVEKELLLIQEGDEVSIDYTGRFLGTDENLGPVFDTSLPEIARNDSIPKSLSFQERPAYDDLTFTVGSGEMIKGFDASVRGKKEGDSFVVAVPPEDAYGASYVERILRIDQIHVIPLRETMPVSEFKLRFPVVQMIESTSFQHPFWDWNVEILDANIEEVTIMNQPVYGAMYQSFPWNTTIVDISSDRNVITLEHDTSNLDQKIPVPFEVFRGFDPLWGSDAMEANPEEPPQEGYITGLSGQITVDFNREVQGKTLVFEITINSVIRS